MKKTVFDDFVPEITGFVYRKCGPDWFIPLNTVNDYNLIYVIKGNAVYKINGTAHEIKPGGLVCLRDGDLVEAIGNSQSLMQHFDVSFRQKYQNSKISTGEEEVLFPPVYSIGLRQDIIDLFRELAVSWNEKHNGYTMKCQALLMLILNRLSEIIVYGVDSAAGDYRINRIIRYISLHYAEKLTVEKLASRIRLDPDYFGQIFKKQTGRTIHQHINQIRVQNAELLLQSGRYKVHEAAERCGFSDIFHFYKKFKSLRGFAPSRCIPR
jgi:YesN/AraC family two-component response regulator